MLRVFTSWYPEPNPARERELLECLDRNLACEAVSAVHLLLERTEHAPREHDKIRAMPIAHRPLYSDFIRWANSMSPGPDDVSVIANSDIWFEESVGVLGASLANDQCAALSRWDRQPDETLTLFDRNDSQDTWVFRGPIRSTLEGEFCVGIPRCDNRFLYELRRAGYEVVNPALSVRSVHVHAGVRGEYPAVPQGAFVPPPYGYLFPQNLWSAPRTFSHNFQHPSQRILWRPDWRMIRNRLHPRAIIARLMRSFSGSKE